MSVIHAQDRFCPPGLWSQRIRRAKQISAEYRRARRTAWSNWRMKRVRQATPKWANYQEIARFYEEAARQTRETGVPHEVDHIIPIAGETVCGLHVTDNLRVIPRADNRRKCNKVDPAACGSRSI